MTKISPWLLVTPLILLFLIIAYFNVGISVVATEHLPRAVHNVCTGKWAVVTEKHGDSAVRWEFFGHDPHGRVYFSGMDLHQYGRGHFRKDDSGSYAPVGEEYTFPDSLSAIRAYKAYTDNLFIEQEQERIKDSIAKCSISYQ